MYVILFSFFSLTPKSLINASIPRQHTLLPSFFSIHSISHHKLLSPHKLLLMKMLTMVGLIIFFPLSPYKSLSFFTVNMLVLPIMDLVLQWATAHLSQVSLTKQRTPANVKLPTAVFLSVHPPPYQLTWSTCLKFHWK